MEGIIDALQALATPAIAAAGITIGYQQKRLADIRLKNDLFERRFKIYHAAIELLRFASNRQNVPVDTMIAYRDGTQTADFFFSSNIQSYLEEIRLKVSEMNVRRAEFDQGGPNAQKSSERAYELQKWCADQILEKTITQKFKPEMGLSS